MLSTLSGHIGKILLFHLINCHWTGFTIGETHLAGTDWFRCDKACAVMWLQVLMSTDYIMVEGCFVRRTLWSKMRPGDTFEWRMFLYTGCWTLHNKIVVMCMVRESGIRGLWYSLLIICPDIQLNEVFFKKYLKLMWEKVALFWILFIQLQVIRYSFNSINWL
jgi:hypothetical protein